MSTGELSEVGSKGASETVPAENVGCSKLFTSFVATKLRVLVKRWQLEPIGGAEKGCQATDRLSTADEV